MLDVGPKPEEISANQFKIKKDFRLEIKSAVNYEFSLQEDGLYAVAVRASAKPGWQNKWWLNFKRTLEDYFDLHLDDDDLRIEIDGRRFIKPGGKKNLFNSPAAISGTKTLGKTKTVIFVLRLAAGIHQIKFIPDGSPYLESVSVEKSADEEKANFTPQATAENENYYSWYTFAVIGIPLQSVHIEAQAQSRQNDSDDDDLKIIINGESQKNPANRHPNSYFCGSSQKGIPTIFTKNLETKEEINYLELYADKTPMLDSVKLSLASPSAKIPQTDIRAYRPGPKGEDYNRFDGVIHETVAFWNAEFLSQDYPPPQPLDPNLVKAMIYVESLVGYGAGQSAYPDVMQVGNVNDPGLHTLNNDGWVDPHTSDVAREYEWRNGRREVLDYHGEANARKDSQSIKWGIRWLYHKAQRIKNGGGRFWQSWEQAVKDYSGGGDPDYLKKVYKIYKNGMDLKGTTLWLPVLLISLVLTLSSLTIITLLASHKIRLSAPGDRPLLSKREERGKTLGVTTQPFIGSTVYQAERLNSESRLAFVRHPLYPAVGLSVIDNLDNIKYFLEGSELKETTPYGEIKGPGEYVKWLEVGDFDGDGMKEIAVQYIVSGSGLFHPFYVYKESGESFRLLLKRNDGVSQAKLIDLNDDGKKEILYSYVIDASGAGPRDWTVWKEVWGWREGGLELVSHKFPAIYKNLILFYDHLLTDPDPDSWLKDYYPMIECLKDKAETNIYGTLADIKTCRDI